METSPRYAIYYVPEQFSELSKFGTRWLGRDMINDKDLPPAAYGKLTADLVYSITETARHYGLHATLKAPFVLQEDMTVDDLDLAVRKLASSRKGIIMPRLILRRLGKFLALRPEHPSPELNELAGACVTELDRFRRRSPHWEIKQRVAKGLSAHQEDMLTRWGYPYVLDEFHFHLTLTDKLDSELFTIVEEELEKEVAPLPLDDIHVDSICLCWQEDRQSPFVLLERYPLLAG